MSVLSEHFDVVEFQSKLLWCIIVGFIVSFILSFAIGANDTANSFGTSVGSKVLKLWQAYVLGTIFETLGSVLLGYKVTDTMREGVVNLAQFNGTEDLLMYGQISTLAGCATWLLLATLLRLPVSTTHSIVGATIGFAIVVHGLHGIRWAKILHIVASWFVSPVLSGIVSCLIVTIINFTVLQREDPFQAGLTTLPFFYFATVAINLFSIFFDGSSLLGFDKIPLWGTVLLSLGVSGIVALCVRLIAVPRLRRQILLESQKAAEHEHELGLSAELEKADAILEDQEKKVARATIETNNNVQEELKDSLLVTPGTDTAVDAATPEGKESLYDKQQDEPKLSGKWSRFFDKVRRFRSVKENVHAAKLFSILQILSAVFGAFAHGGNDVSNSVAPLVQVWLLYKDGAIKLESESPPWLMFYGAAGMCIGLWALGHRVIYTIGEGLTKITPSSGFAVELGSAFTVLFASKLGLPISSTHCKVGSVVCVGWLQSGTAVNWTTFRNIFFSWIVTLPVTGALSATVMALLKLL